MTKLAKVDCKYGAPMGRVQRDINNAGAVKMHLQHVQLDSGGYDEGGAYWGLRPRVNFTRADGMTIQLTSRLYWYWWNGNKPSATKPLIISGFVDAIGREQAKEQIREQYPEATFYR